MHNNKCPEGKSINTLTHSEIEALQEVANGFGAAVGEADLKAVELGVMKEIGPQLDELANLTGRLMTILNMQQKGAGELPSPAPDA